MSELSPTVSAAASTAKGGGDLDVDLWAFDYFLQQMFRNQLDADEEYSTPVVTNEMAKIMANSVSGYSV